MELRANPAKVEDFGDKDLLQHIRSARFLIGEVISLRREARSAKLADNTTKEQELSLRQTVADMSRTSNAAHKSPIAQNYVTMTD